MLCCEHVQVLVPLKQIICTLMLANANCLLYLQYIFGPSWAIITHFDTQQYLEVPNTYQPLTLKDAFIQDNIMESMIQTMYVTS